MDRLLRHSRVLNIQGQSYLLREERQAGPFPSQPHLGASPEDVGDNYADWQDPYTATLQMAHI